MRTSTWLKFNAVTLILAALALGNATSPVAAATKIASTPAGAKNVQVNEADTGDFIGQVAAGAYAGAAWGAVAGTIGLPAGIEAGAITSFYAGAAYSAVMYFVQADDGSQYELTGGKGKLPATVLD